MIKTILNRPLTILTIFILLSIVGIFMMFDLPLDLMPDMTPPYIVIQTVYPSAGPGEVEEEVTEILEEALINLEGLKNITSTSSESLCSITLEFDWGMDNDQLELDVREKIEQIKHTLPEDALDPILWKFDPNMLATVELSIQGEKTTSELNDLAEEIIKPAIEQVPGIAKVEITGNRNKIAKVSVYQSRLEAYDLSVTRVAQALAVQNMSLGAGSVKQGKNELLIRTSGKYDDLKQIENSIITTIVDGGRKYKILVRDVADVFYTDEEETSRVLVNGEPGINILAYKQSGSNTVSAAENVINTVEKIKKELPAGVNILILKDTSQMVKQSLSEVLGAAFMGILCSVVILLLFLRQIRSTLIVALSIPVSILITILGMSLGGKTFNIVALTGLTLGVGMIVDASIVILENIYRHRQKGARLEAASLFGAKEMVTPIIASNLTTICVFLPILLFGKELGSLGAIMNDMAFTVIIAMISSLVVALFLVPVLTGHFLPVHTRQEKPIKNRVLKALDSGMEFLLHKIEAGYKIVLEAALKNKTLTILTALLLLTFSFMQIPKLGISFMPSQAEDSVTLNVELPVGTSLETTKGIMDQLGAIARNNLTGYIDIFQTAGKPDKASGNLTITLPELGKRSTTPEEIKNKMREFFPDFPDAMFSFTDGGMLGSRMLGGGAGISIKIKSTNLEKAVDYAGKIKEIITSYVPELTDVKWDVKDGLPQVEIVIDREKAYDLGLTVQSAAVEIRSQLSGTTATVLSKDNKNYDVTVQLREEDRLDLKDLEKIFVLTPAGMKVPVSSFASLQKNNSPVSIIRENKVRTVTLSGSLVPGASSNFTEDKAKEMINQYLEKDEEVRLEYGGEMKNVKETGEGLMMTLIFAILLVFGVMISQFESLKAPFIVLLSMPMLAIGVIGIYLIMRTPFSMVSMIGIIMLSGIVVNNGIVLVDFIGLLRKRGETLFSACLNAGVTRLRPILMTTLTTILAMVPLAFFSGEGGALMQPLGVTVVGGLAVNTLISLIFIPVLYYIFFQKEEAR